jgi:spermidine/putrescine transport system substrate-binding protein
MLKGRKNQSILAVLVCLTLILGFGIQAWSADRNYPVPKACLDQVRAEGNKLNIYDWAEWYPEELFEGFTKEFGVKITRDHFASTDEMMTKFMLNPKTPYDLVLGTGPNNVMKMAPVGLLQKINYDYLPNVKHYLMDGFKSADFDPGNQYHVPSALYMVTFALNSRAVLKIHCVFDPFK